MIVLKKTIIIIIIIKLEILQVFAVHASGMWWEVRQLYLYSHIYTKGRGRESNRVNNNHHNHITDYFQDPTI